MKMIFITREGYNLSGARVRCYGFTQELKKYNIETEVFSFADDLGAKYALKPAGQNYSSLISMAEGKAGKLKE